MVHLFHRMQHLLLLSLAVLSAGQHPIPPNPNSPNSLSIGVIVFPGFEPLDVFGPLEILFQLSNVHNMTLAVIAEKPGPVSSRAAAHSMGPGQPVMDMGHMISPTIVATHDYQTAPELDVIIVPGGLGIMVIPKEDTAIEDFIRARADRAQYLLSVCTGAIGLARAGVLEGRRATSNKSAFRQVVTYGKDVTWVPTARWVQDGKVWTSSGVAAGMDMTYAFLRHVYGEDDTGLTGVMNLIEYAPHTDPHWDPFSIVYNVTGADFAGAIEGVVRPVGW